MKAHLLKIPNISDSSFSFRQFKQSNINNRWHFHPEIELIRIHQGSGTQFMGDSIKRFESGDVVLVGSNLPHFWRYDEEEKREDDGVYATVLHFTASLWGDRFMNMPENILIKTLLQKSKRGLLLRGKTQTMVADFLDKINTAQGTYRLIHLLECLVAMAIAPSEELIPLSSLGFEHQSSEAELDRINMIYDYTFKNFRERIPLETIAAMVNLVPSSFCRYFKSKTGKSYTDFILEIKVGHACKLLHENKMSIKLVCFESGFNNFTSFHKHFKTITGLSPQNYQKSYFVK
jgi:AraC-like DNA-binding protein